MQAPPPYPPQEGRSAGHIYPADLIAGRPRRPVHHLKTQVPSARRGQKCRCASSLNVAPALQVHCTRQAAVRRAAGSAGLKGRLGCGMLLSEYQAHRSANRLASRWLGKLESTQNNIQRPGHCCFPRSCAGRASLGTAQPREPPTKASNLAGVRGTSAGRHWHCQWHCRNN